MSYEKFISYHELPENLAQELRRQVLFLQCFDFWDATEETDEVVTFTKMTLRGFIVVEVPTAGNLWSVKFHLDEAQCLNKTLINYNDFTKLVQTIGGLLAMCLSPEPYALRREGAPELPGGDIVKPVQTPPPVPAYFSDPAYIVDVVTGIDPEDQMREQAEKHGAAIWMQFVGLGGVVAKNVTIASKTLEQCQRYAEALDSWTVISQCVYSSHKIIDQPTFDNWIDAKHKCKELAEEHGYAVVITDIDIDGCPTKHHVIAGETVEECIDLAGSTTPSFEWKQGQVE